MPECPKIICLTPVKNEAWILERFLRLASLWADHIIIADQFSTDGSQDIARRFEKVILVNNTSEAFNEPGRQKLLIDEARKIEGPKLLITLDADECFTPNYATSTEWQTMLNAKPGTIFKFQMVHFQPDLRSMRYDIHYNWGYMDDGADHIGQKIHSTRIPLPKGNPAIALNEIKIIHFQFTDWERMKSKHRWYMCYERINFPKRSSITIYRMYHQMYSFPKDHYAPIPQKWFEDYGKLGIDISSVYCEGKLFWDREILNLFDQYGTAYFKREAIWDVDWVDKARMYGKANPEVYKDPRSKWYRKIQTYLSKTQPQKNKFQVKQVLT
jgi:glycosyltransferase involved in cell wall biosynthesis